jgi:acyl-CoA thioester hydrolase
MKNFEIELTVSQDDLDDLNHVNNVRYVQWIQDISKEHWQRYASKQIQKDVIWVVMNHNITYKNAAVLNDKIKIHTHISENRGAKCIRIVEMHNAITNQLLVRSKTEWCLLNAKSLRPIRISEEIKNVFT